MDSALTPLNMALQQDMVGTFGSELEALEAAEAEGCSGSLMGCAAVVALVDNKRLIVANAGDSRYILSLLLLLLLLLNP
jgi:serine/threonine protein phosphatase PrpC